MLPIVFRIIVAGVAELESTIETLLKIDFWLTLLVLLFPVMMRNYRLLCHDPTIALYLSPLPIRHAGANGVVGIGYRF